MLHESQTAECAVEENRFSPSVSLKPSKLTRLAFVTNFCPHYRVKTLEILATLCDVDFLFYSDGAEWYWQKNHGTRSGQFHHKYLRGVSVMGTRITPGLVTKLWRGNYDAIVAGIDGRFALAAAYLIARLRRKPFVLWTGIWSAIDTPFHRLFSRIIRHVYSRSNAVVVYGEHVKRYLLSLGVAEEKVFVAPHAINNEEYSGHVSRAEIETLRSQLTIAPTDRVVLFFGRVEEIKGLPYLLQAFRQVARADTVLVIAGEGNERADLQKMAADLGIENRVRFVGYVPPECALPYYAMAYALALPSVSVRYGKELWGLVVNEAMNQGVPVIASDSVGAAAGGLVQDGLNGFIVPERDSAALANAIQTILDSLELHDAMSREARRTIAEWNNEEMMRGFQRAVDYAVQRVDPALTSL
jgi:glycosyltransferase involved in cell wall biosynthesis